MNYGIPKRFCVPVDGEPCAFRSIVMIHKIKRKLNELVSWESRTAYYTFITTLNLFVTLRGRGLDTDVLES